MSEEIFAAARTIGFPVFIRTDLASAKHWGPESYRIDQDGDQTAIALKPVDLCRYLAKLILPPESD